ncbi:MAG TPA: ATP-dependent DNA ligase [Candidatus Acidoferrum sp.]|nr:ATP-dependent DNA ligase [Candidatus Acidoferrum sp.]
MNAFVQLCEAIAASSKKSEKVRLAADFFRAVSSQEASVAALFLTGRVFPRREERVLGIAGSLLVRALLKISGWNKVQFAEVYRRHGDLGSAADDILQAHTWPSPLKLPEIKDWFQALAKERRRDSKLRKLEEMLRQLSAIETKYVLKLATGELRIGMKESLVEEAIAQAYQQPLPLIERANMLCGDIGEIVQWAVAGKLQTVELQLFRPISVMLANPADGSGELIASFPNGAIAEDKYDGIRAQVHKQGERVEFYSRTLDRITAFPELAEPLRKIPGDFILDGEIVAWRDNRALPFRMLQPRLGRNQFDLFVTAEAPIIFMAFDILHRDGVNLLDTPLSERRKQLEALQSQSDGPAVHLAQSILCETAEQYDQAFQEAVQRGNEGLIVKAADSLYLPGRRGRFWLKWKKPLAKLDVVVTAVEYGHGKRHGVLSDYTFAIRDRERLLDIGKAYSGLTDVEIHELTTFFLQKITGREGGRLQVQPLVVLEVAFNNLQKSRRYESGFALRFPRIVRFRQDKTPAEIDTLETVKMIFERQNRLAAGTA